MALSVPTEDAPTKPIESLLVREYAPADSSFIYRNFIVGAYQSYAYRDMPKPMAEKFLAMLLDKLIERCQIVVLCEENDRAKVHGFAISERPFTDGTFIALHFVYVRYEHRKLGLGTAMIRTLGHSPPHTRLFSTIMTPCWFHAVGAKYGAIYNPFFLFSEFQKDKEQNR